VALSISCPSSGIVSQSIDPGIWTSLLRIQLAARRTSVTVPAKIRVREARQEILELRPGPWNRSSDSSRIIPKDQKTLLKARWGLNLVFKTVVPMDPLDPQKFGAAELPRV